VTVLDPVNVWVGVKVEEDVCDPDLDCDPVEVCEAVIAAVGVFV
jgi:hypothetical protein